MTHYLKFTDEAEFLFEFDVYVDEEYGLVISGVGYDFDVIGIISKPTGEVEVDDEGYEYPTLAPIDGWHVNWLGELPESLQAYALEEPNNPYRVFAGHEPKQEGQNEYI
jgi:hypothetical protein